MADLVPRASDAPEIVSTRHALFKEIFLRRGVVWLLVIYNGLQLVYNLVGWFLPPETQAKYQLINTLKYASGRNWIIGLLLTAIGIVFEGSFRFIQHREISYRSDADNLRRRLTEIADELANERTLPKLEGKIHQVYVLDTMDEYGICSFVTIQASMTNVRKTPTTVHEFSVLLQTSDAEYRGTQVPAAGFAYFEPPSFANNFEEAVYQLGVWELPRSPVQGYREGPTEREKWLRFRVPRNSFSDIGQGQKVTLMANDIRGFDHKVATAVPPWVTKGKVDFSPMDNTAGNKLRALYRLRALHQKGHTDLEHALAGHYLLSKQEIGEWALEISTILKESCGMTYEIEFTSCMDKFPLDEKHPSSVAHRQRAAYLYPRLEKLLAYMKELEV